MTTNIFPYLHHHKTCENKYCECKFDGRKYDLDTYRYEYDGEWNDEIFWTGTKKTFARVHGSDTEKLLYEDNFKDGQAHGIWRNHVVHNISIWDNGRHTQCVGFYRSGGIRIIIINRDTFKNVYCFDKSGHLYTIRTCDLDRLTYDEFLDNEDMTEEEYIESQEADMVGKFHDFEKNDHFIGYNHKTFKFAKGKL